MSVQFSGWFMKAEERKTQILAAALKAFAEHGYERTSIAKICHKAGIARPTLYQYFKDKQSVFRELLQTYLRGMHAKVHARQGAKNKDKALSKQEEMSTIHWEWIEEISTNRDLYQILLKEAKARNAETEDIVKDFLRALMQELMSEMRSRPGSEEMGERDIEFAVVYMIGGLMQAVEYYLLGSQRIMSNKELAEKITAIEMKIKG